MKKLFYGAVCALMLAGTACNNSDSDSQPKFLSDAQVDTLIGGMGELRGYALNQQIQQVMQQDSTFSKEQFLKGFQYIMSADTSRWFMAGIQVGIGAKQQLSSYQQMGLDFNTSLFANQFKKAVMADSVPDQMMLQELQNRLQVLEDSLHRAKRAYDKLKLENSPEAKANIEAGQKYIKSLQAKDKDVKVTSSGLAYKIAEPGAAEKIKATDQVKLKAVGKTLKGNNPPSVNDQVVTVSQLPDGLKEGVMMLGIGGKATLYIPGPLAFGVEGAQGAGLEPNQMVIYEVETAEVPQPETLKPGARQ